MIEVSKINPVFSGGINFFIKKTFYKYFCGGENLHEVSRVVDDFKHKNIKSILDLAIEEYCTTNVSKILKVIDTASLNTDNFVSIKMSCLVPKKNLETGQGIDLKHIHEICMYAKNKDVMLMIDAEHSSIQKSIDDIVLNLSNEYNDTTKPIIWNTYQMYLKDSLPRLIRDVSNIKNSKLGVKLVRGAYMSSEDPELIHDNIQNTHKNYNDAVLYCINQLDKIELMIASHNEETVEIATNEIKLRNIDRKNLEKIKFGQLLGMKDLITFNLAEQGYSVYKYIPYGPVDTAIPYLIRRAEENSEMIKDLPGDLELYKKEIYTRFFI